MNKKEVRTVAKKILPLIIKQITDGGKTLISDEGVSKITHRFDNEAGEEYSIGYSFYMLAKKKKLYSISYRLILIVEEEE